MKENIKIKADELCAKHDVELLYLCKFGSHLYGTNTPESDSDYKGIFLPSKERCFLQQKIKSIQYNNGAEGRKNTKDDVDLQLWSLQYFLELVGKGETNALDLLYSAHYREMVLYEETWFHLIYNSYRDLFDIKHCKAFVGYAIGQARKYGIKGSRLGAIKKVYEYTKPLINEYKEHSIDNVILLSSIIDNIDKKFHDSSFCFIKEFGKDEKTRGLVLCGKVHLETIKVLEFFNRIKKQYEVYGDRAKLAEENKGIDWKALSHAVRALFQMEELIETGKINYPLAAAEEICKIKKGEYGFKSVEKLILDKIEKIDNDLNVLTNPLNKKKQLLINELILFYYQ